jgi:hypothetical protein
VWPQSPRSSHRNGNKRQSKKRLLSGLPKCGRCGGGMTISRGDRYYCSARREKGTCDADAGIAAHELEERVLNGLRDIFLGNEASPMTAILYIGSMFTSDWRKCEACRNWTPGIPTIALWCGYHFAHVE